MQVSGGILDFFLPFDRVMINVLGPYASYTYYTVNLHQAGDPPLCKVP
jgi:hypothetical protein